MSWEDVGQDEGGEDSAEDEGKQRTEGWGAQLFCVAKAISETRLLSRSGAADGVVKRLSALAEWPRPGPFAPQLVSADFRGRVYGGAERLLGPIH